MQRTLLSLAAALGVLGACTPTADKPVAKPPATRTVDVNDIYFGQVVADPYRWLENWNDPEVKAWSAAQTAYTRSLLDALPERAAIHTRVAALMSGTDATAFGNLTFRTTGLFAMKYDPKLQQALLVVLPSATEPDKARTLVDPNAMDTSGGLSIDWYRVSNNGKTLAVSMSRGGSESGDVHLFDAATGKETGEITTRVQGGTAGGDLAWLPDDSGFFYTRYPHEGERAPADMTFFQQVWLHKLGDDPKKDIYVLGKEFPRIGETRLATDKTGRLLITVQDGDSNRFAHWLRFTDGSIGKVSTFDDQIGDLAFAPDGRLVGMSWHDDPKGEIIALPAKLPKASAAKTLVPAAGDGALGTAFYDLFSPTVSVIGDRIYAIYQTGGPAELRVFDLSGKRLANPAQAPIATIGSVTDAGAAGVLFTTTSYTISQDWSAYDPKTGAVTKLPISSPATVDYADVDVVREEATSRDGTKIPVNILVPKGAKLDGTRAVVVTGYGGYAINITPNFSRSRHILAENGVLFAQANLRGGSEFGEAWHRAGMLTSKQNVFDDFIAVIEHLTARGYAAKDRIAITGGSNGGLLMGAIVTQRPELATVVVSEVGGYDLLRYELNPNGAYNIPEYGTVKDEAQFKALYAYSPYHHVTTGAHYPAMLMPTGANDPRVDPMNSRKFTAALQAAQGGGAPILLNAIEGRGHHSGSISQAVETTSDSYAFMFHALNVPVH